MAQTLSGPTYYPLGNSIGCISPPFFLILAASAGSVGTCSLDRFSQNHSLHVNKQWKRIYIFSLHQIFQ